MVLPSETMNYCTQFLSLIIWCYFWISKATAQSNNVASCEDRAGIEILNILKSENEILKLRIENLELKQTINFEMIHKKLSHLESQLNRRQQPQRKVAEAVDNMVTRFNGDEEPQLCFKDVNENFICSNITLPTRCSTSNAMNCWLNKCRIKNRLLEKSFLINCVERMGEKGWTTIQRRVDKSIEFHRNWTEYKQGFGDPDGNYWMGLDKLYALTTLWSPVELLVIMEDFENVTKFAKYDAFAVGDENSKFALKVLGAYTGTAGDSMTHHKGAKFTTLGQDNDKVPTRNCALPNRGGWWYTQCFSCNLNGRYFDTGNGTIYGYHEGIHWDKFHGVDYSLKSVEMLIRPQ